MINQQITALVLTLLLGIVMGLIFNCYNSWRRIGRFGKITGLISDLLIWVGLTVMVFSVLLGANQGVVRFYIFIGLGTGLLFYQWILARLFTPIINRLLTMIYWLGNGLWRSMRGPFFFLPGRKRKK